MNILTNIHNIIAIYKVLPIAMNIIFFNFLLKHIGVKLHIIFETKQSFV